MPEHIPVRWHSGSGLAETAAPAVPPWPNPPLSTQIGRGLAGRCPACGEGKIFAGYLRVVPACAHCGAPLGMLRSDDAPPYLTILIVGHIVVGLLLIMEQNFSLSLWTEAEILLPLTLVLALGLLRPIKGATVGLMLRLGILIPPQ